MKVREVEIGGVYNIENYENVRVAVRVAVEGELGKTLISAFRLCNKLAVIVAFLRRYHDIYAKLERELESTKSRIKYLESEIESVRKKRREYAMKKVQPILDKLDPKLREAIEKDPEVAINLGLVDVSCVVLKDVEELQEELEEKTKLKEEIEKAREFLYDKYWDVRGKVERGLFDEALEAVKEVAEHENIGRMMPDIVQCVKMYIDQQGD